MSDPLWIGAGKDTSIGTATIAAATDLFTITAHGLSDSDTITVDTLTGGAVGVLVENAVYFVRDATADTFAVSLTPGGPVVDFSADGGADVYRWAPQYNAKELRQLIGGLLYYGVLSNRFDARSGVLANSAGDGFVSLAGTTWTVNNVQAVVSPGITDQSGPYLVVAPFEQGELDPPDGTNPRIDALDLQVQDDDEDASGFRRSRIVYVAGTPGATPTPPALTANALRLAEITVPQSGGGAATMETVALLTVARGGILPVRDDTELPNSGRYPGTAAYRQDTGALEVWDGSLFTTVGSVHGYQFGGRVIFTSSGLFTKGDFPGLRAVDATLIGGGGGSGGVAACGAGEAAEAGGGAGGSGAKRFIDASELFSSSGVTVGAGGNGGSTGANPGSAGGESSFSISGTDVAAPGGGGGAGGSASSANAVSAGGSAGAPGSAADIGLQGSTGGNGVIRGGESVRNNFGGPAAFGMGPAVLTFGASSTGEDGHNYGGGASGPRNNDGDSAQSGQPGQSGIVILDLYF